MRGEPAPTFYLPVLDDEARLMGIVNTDDVLGTRRPGGTGAQIVGAVMSSPVVSIGPTAPLSEAMRVMASRRVGALPVVDADRVIGVLTQSDIVAALARQQSP